jgi:hypothetical protein
MGECPSAAGVRPVGRSARSRIQVRLRAYFKSSRNQTNPITSNIVGCALSEQRDAEYPAQLRAMRASPQRMKPPLHASIACIQTNRAYSDYKSDDERSSESDSKVLSSAIRSRRLLVMPALCRASTSYLVPSKKDVDGRHKPSHDDRFFSQALRISRSQTDPKTRNFFNCAIRAAKAKLLHGIVVLKAMSLTQRPRLGEMPAVSNDGFASQSQACVIMYQGISDVLHLSILL